MTVISMETKENGALSLREELAADAAVLGEQAECFVRHTAPYLTLPHGAVKTWLDARSDQALEGMRFFRLNSCTTEGTEDLAQYLHQRMDKLFTAIHALGKTVAYGIVSRQGTSNLLLGVEDRETEDIAESLLRGLLTGVSLTPYTPRFHSLDAHPRQGGILTSVPVLQVDDDKQRFDISPLMKSLNGQDYTVLFLARPCTPEETEARYRALISVRDKCFALSRKNLSRQGSQTVTSSHTQSSATSSAWNVIIYSHSSTASLSDSVSKAVCSGQSVSQDIQNGFALELMGFCDKAIERLKRGQNIGMWETAAVYAAHSPAAAGILRACLSGELSRADTDTLPLRGHTYPIPRGQEILIPRMERDNPLLAPITSAELGFICTPPFESVPDFELRQGKVYPMIASAPGGVVIGKVSDGHRPIPNMDFSLSEADLNKHTFVCGITGSGKTTTVKNILRRCDKPFMVIESAKKEYRNLRLPAGRKAPVIYTLGKPELNCLQFNPFYIQCGINLQTHIDYLKDLFNASFSFYGPMPYILEQCLYNVYRKKGWNLTLGYHPKLVNRDNAADIFDSGYMKGRYALAAHQYLFPTMGELKEEVKRYVEQEMQYDSEVGGNVKTAILARLNSLCVGAKGFMLNTSVPFDAQALLNENVIFELEGLADDSDKAFCVGLLVVFINEYRQIFREEHFAEQLGLQHLLVIEEAHRLLKNVDTERTSENMGNPKGKAVEHFTNMLAELRSYGQGVIIAEQIPGKLAPDVIKNSSNKIIHRVVCADDQALVAGTIGMKEEDALYLGSLETGQALCHKEGMGLPVQVFVASVEDNFVRDGDIFLKKDSRAFEEINRSLIQEQLIPQRDILALKLLNTLLAQDGAQFVQATKYAKETLAGELVGKAITLVMCRNRSALFGAFLAEGVIRLLINGVYAIPGLMPDDLCANLTRLFVSASPEAADKVRACLQECYKQGCRSRCILIVSQLIKRDLTRSTDIKASIQQYFFDAPPELVEEVEAAVRKEVF